MKARDPQCSSGTKCIRVHAEESHEGHDTQKTKGGGGCKDPMTDGSVQGFQPISDESPFALKPAVPVSRRPVVMLTLYPHEGCSYSVCTECCCIFTHVTVPPRLPHRSEHTPASRRQANPHKTARWVLNGGGSQHVQNVELK